jgi:ubiquinone biosynthesis protein
MGEQMGWRGLVERLKAEAPRYAHIFPQLPRLAYRALDRSEVTRGVDAELLRMLVIEQRRTNRLLGGAALVGGLLLLGTLAVQLRAYWPTFA